MAKINTAIDMTYGNPYKLYIQYAIPLVLGNFFQQLYNIVDTAVVGNVLGKSALAAVGSGFPFLFLLTAVFIGLGMGSMIVVSQLAGQRDEENLQRILGTIYRLIFAGAIPLTILGIVFAGPVLHLLQVQEVETFNQARLYLSIVFLGTVGSFGFNVNAGFLMGMGDSMSSLLFLSIATVLNIVLDLVLTLVIPLGVLGVAIATSFSQTFAWVFGIFYINRRYTYLHINLLHLPFDKMLLKRSIQLGLPGSIQQFLYAVGNMVIQALVNRNGDVFTAGFVAANKVDTFVFLPILSLATSITTFVGQNVGKHDLKRVRAGTRAGLLIMGMVSIGFAGLIYLFRDATIAIFNQDPDVVQAGLYYLESVLPFYLLLGLLYGVNAIFQGAGETVWPMLTASVAFCFARIPLALGITFYLGASALYFSYPISWAIGLTLSIGYYFMGRWRHKMNLDVVTGEVRTDIGALH